MRWGLFFHGPDTVACPLGNQALTRRDRFLRSDLLRLGCAGSLSVRVSAQELLRSALRAGKREWSHWQEGGASVHPVSMEEAHWAEVILLAPAARRMR